MNKFFKFLALGLVPVMAISFTACSDDDSPNDPTTPGNGGSSSEPTVENVFTEGLPASVEGATFTTNDKGQVTKIVDGSTTVSFEYGSFDPAKPSKAHNFTVLMKEREAGYPDEGSDIYMELNKQGFVTYAYQVYLDGDDDPEEWWFEYNADGQLTRLKRTEGGDEYKATYTNGDITSVSYDEEDGDHSDFTFTYTNATFATPIANKGCIMLFDQEFEIDMDEMGVAYYAGLLGKATKNLPLGYKETAKQGSSTYTYTEEFTWTLNAAGLPTSFQYGDSPYDTVTFSWK